MEDILSVSFSPEAMEIIKHCLYPPTPSISFDEEMQLLHKYRSFTTTEESKYWQSLDWDERFNLFHALDVEEKIILLSLRSPDDLCKLLLRLPSGDLLELRIFFERSGILQNK